MTQINYKMFRPKTIICIVGPSGSGKTTIANILADNGIPTIVSYTTRPMRDGETNGKEHWFVTPENVPEQSTMMAYTQFGNYEYWTTIQQFVHPICTYVIDEKGIEYFKEKWKDKYILFFLYVDRKLEKRTEDGVDEDRIKRDEDRITIPLDQYDYVLHNNYTIEELKEKLKDFANGLLNEFK